MDFVLKVIQLLDDRMTGKNPYGPVVIGGPALIRIFITFILTLVAGYLISLKYEWGLYFLIGIIDFSLFPKKLRFGVLSIALTLGGLYFLNIPIILIGVLLAFMLPMKTGFFTILILCGGFIFSLWGIFGWHTIALVVVMIITFLLSKAQHLHLSTK